MRESLPSNVKRRVSTFATLLFFFCALGIYTTFCQEAQSHPYERDMERFEKEDQANPPTSETTFFVGSSTFTIWKEIPTDFSEYHAVNRGFGGSQISEWLEFACDRALIKHKPNRIVFFCGCNDIASGKSAERVFADFQAFLRKMRAVNPDLVVHFCSLHMPASRQAYWETFRKYNAAVKSLSEFDSNLYYIDFAGPTSDGSGAGIPSLFQSDRLHLNRAGEERLIPLIKASIRQELSDKAKKAKKSLAPQDDVVLYSEAKDGFLGREITTTSQDIVIESDAFEVHQTFGSNEISVQRQGDVFVITLKRTGAQHPYAKTSVTFSEVKSLTEIQTKTVGDPPDISVAGLKLSLSSGWELIFSDSYQDKGFVTIDYQAPLEGLLQNEELPTWELTNFNGVPFENLKAFGTGGLKAVDGHAGSYTFLSIVDPSTRAGVVGGWITSEKSGGVLFSNKTEAGIPTMTPRLDFGHYENAGRKFTERFVLGEFDDCRLGLENYADSIARYYSIELNPSAVTGYCTWYSDKNGGACNENAMKELGKSIEEKFGAFGFQYVQIDDRWQLGNSKNGPNKNFTTHNPNGPYPSGMGATSSFLNSHALAAGLWFMPFSGNFDDPYWSDKQDLFVRSAIDYPEAGQKNTRRFSSINQKKGAPYETYWGGTSLDMTNPKALSYVEDIVRRITQDWGYKFIKIDGMWVAGAIEQLYVDDEYTPDDMGNQIFYDPTRTNVETFRTGLQLVRDTAKDTFILGCNVSQNMRVLAASYGLVDGMRVGPDNGASWNGICTGPWRGSNRYFYNGRVWYNDPDPVYVRTSIPLKHAQVSATWASISGQLYALSDWIPDYDETRVDLVRKTIPNHFKTNVRPVDLFEQDLARTWILTDESTGVRRDVVALFNWHDGDGAKFEYTPERLGLPTTTSDGQRIEKYVGYDFWNDEFVEPFSTFQTTLDKETCKVFAIRAVESHPILLSTSRHITQGIVDIESETWNAENQTLTIVAKIPPQIKYELRVYNPSTGNLDKWTVPEACVGVHTIEYRNDENGAPIFTILQ